MAKRIFKMVVPVEMAAKQKNNTGNIHQFINKVPCDAEKFNEPTEAVSYVDEEMFEYPISKRAMASTRRKEGLEEQIKLNLLSDKVSKLRKLALKLESNLTYLQLEEVTELIPLFSKKQLAKYERELKLLANKISFKVLSEQTTQDHTMALARKAIALIQKSLSSKIHQLH